MWLLPIGYDGHQDMAGRHLLTFIHKPYTRTPGESAMRVSTSACLALLTSCLLAAGEAPLTVTPTSLDLVVPAGSSLTTQLTLTNSSGSELPYVISSTLGAYEIASIPYVWTDIRASGTLVPEIADFWPYPTIPLGFDFPFYGNTFTQCFASFEGFLSFGPQFSPWYYGTLPHNGAPPNLIAFYMAQIYGSIFFLGTDAQSTLHYQRLDADTTAIQFTDLLQTQTGARVTCQIRLRRDGRIQVYYQDIDPDDSILVGVQNQTQDHGVVFQYPDASSGWDDGHAIEIAPGGWLSLPEPTGVLASGQTRQVPVVLTAESWRRGRFLTSLHISAGPSNGPPVAVRDVPVSMTVTSAEPARISFVTSATVVREGGAPMQLVFRRGGSSAGSVSAQIALLPVPGSSATASDVHIVTTVRWADGETGDQIVSISASNDRLPEPSEVLLLRLSRPLGGAVLATGSARQCFVTVTDNDSRPAPRPWRSADIGVSQTVGSTASIAPHTLTVTGGGDRIGGNDDAFRFCHRVLRGDGVLITRLENQQRSSGRALAGIMLRQNLDPSSAHVFIGLSPDRQLRWLRRSSQAASTRTTGGLMPPGPRWLRLERSGSTVTASTSADGITWVDAGTTQLPAGPLLAGLAVGSGDARLLNAATFSPTFLLPYLTQ